MNIKSILITAVLLIAFAVTSQAQYTVVRVIESYSNNMSEIQIAYENGETETIGLDKINGRNSGVKTDNSLSNIKIIAETLNMVKNKEYKLIGTSAGGGGQNMTSIQTYIFEKED